jgi:hypothetical protein
VAKNTPPALLGTSHNFESRHLSPGNLLDELQSTLAHGTVARRVETLRQ